MEHLQDIMVCFVVVLAIVLLGGPVMAEKKVEDYAFKHGLSNSMAKRRVKAHKSKHSSLPTRGVPIAGTGKPKGAQKG